jgi:hypothetical protein
MKQTESSAHVHLPNSRVRDAAWRLRSISFTTI